MAASTGNLKKGTNPISRAEVSRMRANNPVIAVLCSDIHLSHTPPVARSAEPDWYKAMARPLWDLHALSEEHQCPVICAGDIFDKYNPPPELINFALENLPPDMYCIPGQHDLPLHSYKDIKKSGYWTLVQAEKIIDIGTASEGAFKIGRLKLWGFPWGHPVQPCTGDDDHLHLAVVHSYIWMKEYGYPGAPESARVKSWIEKLAGYDASVFGDNHKGFKVNSQIFNCGTLMRRKVDEINYKPQVGLLHKNGTITQHFLDCSQDKFVDEATIKRHQVEGIDTDRFMVGLAKLGGAVMDFSEAVRRWLDDKEVDPFVRRIILEAMGEERP